MKRLNMTISDDLDALLERMAEEKEATKSEILRRALTLYDVVYKGQQKGQRLGLVKNGRVETEIVGI